MSKIDEVTSWRLEMCLFAALGSPGSWQARVQGLLRVMPMLGSVAHPGTFWSTTAQAYTQVAASGERKNVWSTADAFHFV